MPLKIIEVGIEKKVNSTDPGRFMEAASRKSVAGSRQVPLCSPQQFYSKFNTAASVCPMVIRDFIMFLRIVMIWKSKNKQYFDI